eukprot:scaffold9190_cov91-Phaeocystis_antarctica.AAC.2
MDNAWHEVDDDDDSWIAILAHLRLTILALAVALLFAALVPLYLCGDMCTRRSWAPPLHFRACSADEII